MADRVTASVPQLDVDAHPAARAWRSLSGIRGGIRRIEVLKETSKTRAYLLCGAGSDGLDIVAKRKRRDAIQYERTIHDVVLARLPVTSLRLHGWMGDDAEFGWIFLEYSGGQRLSYDAPSHREAATRWLGTAHAVASRHDLGWRLPDRGASHYRRHLQSGCETLIRYITNPVLSAEEIDLLRRVVALCERLDARWDDVDASCAVLPATFVHGDFVPKNVHVRERGGQVVVLPFDWEMAGWGVPAADLERVDIDLYRSIVSDAWPQLGPPDLDRMRTLGSIFRLLAAISWKASSFRGSWVKNAADRTALYFQRLAAAMRTAGLE